MSDRASSVTIGIDIGGTKIMAGVVTQSGDILHHQQIATPSTPPEILSAVEVMCATLLARTSEVVEGIGIGSAGMVDSSTGQVVYANENLPGWTGTRLTALSIGRQLPIVAGNDVRAMAYGEARLGAGRDYQSVLCVTVGTGVGGGLILNGDIWQGATYSAGEIGYLVVDWDGDKPLQLDQFASGLAIERAYQDACKLPERIPLTEISQRAETGDAKAVTVIQEKASKLGSILGGYVTSINPQAVVIGGGVPQIGALWWDALTDAFYSSVPTPVQSTHLLKSSLGVEAVLLGAAMLAWKGGER